MRLVDRDRLEAYLAEREAAAPQAIVPRARGPVAPLSFAQQQVWLHAQLAPELPLYNEPLTIRRRGPLDVAALEAALTELVGRHEAWRTLDSARAGVNGTPAPRRSRSSSRRSR